MGDAHEYENVSPNPSSELYLPTRARMTVRRGAAGKAMVIFISNIWRRSTEKKQTAER